MKLQSEKTSVRTYLDYGYNYVVVLVENEYVVGYETEFCKTRSKAEKYNRERLQGFGKVMTTRQAMKEYEFITE